MLSCITCGLQKPFFISYTDREIKRGNLEKSFENTVQKKVGHEEIF